MWVEGRDEKNGLKPTYGQSSVPNERNALTVNIEAIAVCTRLFCKTFAQWTGALSGEGTSASSHFILLLVDHKMCVHMWSSREKRKGQIRIDLVYGVKWIVLQNRRKYGERKTQKILCYKYLKFCQCASGGFVLRCRQCKEGEICGRKMKSIESGQNLHWIPNWLWLPPASGLGNQTIKISQFLPISDYPKTKLRIYWNNYWEIIWNDPNKQRGHRRDN